MLVTELPVVMQVRLVVELGLVVLPQQLVLEEKGWLPKPYQLPGEFLSPSAIPKCCKSKLFWFIKVWLSSNN
jgi:hypothetical protein